MLLDFSNMVFRNHGFLPSQVTNTLSADEQGAGPTDRCGNSDGHFVHYFRNGGFVLFP